MSSWTTAQQTLSYCDPSRTCRSINSFPFGLLCKSIYVRECHHVAIAGCWNTVSGSSPEGTEHGFDRQGLVLNGSSNLSNVETNKTTSDPANSGHSDSREVHPKNPKPSGG